MKLSKIIYTASAVTFLFGGSVYAQEVKKMDMNFPVTPIESPLTQQQSQILAFYMDHPHAAEMKKLPKSIQSQLPLYIAFHANELDPSAVIRFKRSQLLDAGMSFNDILTLQSALADLHQGGVLTKDQNQFLNDFISNQIRNNPSLALDGFIQPLFMYVRDNPNVFSKKTAGYLNDALLSSVGMKSGEIARINELAASKETLNLSNTDVTALNKLILAGQLQGLDFMNAPDVLRIQAVVQSNASRFNDQNVYILDAVIRNSPSIQKFTYDTFRAAEISNQRRMAPGQSMPQGQRMDYDPMQQRPMNFPQQPQQPQQQRMYQ